MHPSKLISTFEPQEVEINVLPKFKPIFGQTKRIIRIQGGAGSGKSFQVALLLLHFSRSLKNSRLFAFRKVGRTVKHSIFALFEDIISEYGLTNEYKLNKSFYQIECLLTGTTITCLGLDDREKIKSVKDPEVIWIEEATEFNAKDFRQLNLRLRKPGGLNKLILTYNPISVFAWIYKEFVANNYYDDSTDYLKTSYLDNDKLPKEYIDELNKLSLIDPNLDKVYKKGLWGSHNHKLVFTPDSYIINKELVESEFLSAKKIIYGLDWGFNDPTVIIKIGITKTGLTPVKEIFYKSKVTPSELAERVLPELGVNKNDFIFADSSRPGSIMELDSKGYSMVYPSYKKQGSVKSRISLLKSKKLVIHDDSINLIKELSRYSYVETKEGYLTDEPVDAFNHAIDAMGYGIQTYEMEFMPHSGSIKAWT